MSDQNKQDVVRPAPLTREAALAASKTGTAVVDSYGETTTVIEYSAGEDMVWLALAAGTAKRPRREVYPVDTWTAWAAENDWPGIAKS